MKMPTTLDQLEKLATSDHSQIGADEWDDEVQPWLEYVLESLQSRKLYMKKQQLRKKIILQRLKEQFSPDEIEEMDRQAEEETNALSTAAKAV
jgi:hypothetical protein